MAVEHGLAIVERGADGVDTAFREDVLAGLRQRHKAIPARWFYDDTGSELFEAITAQDLDGVLRRRRFGRERRRRRGAAPATLAATPGLMGRRAAR